MLDYYGIDAVPLHDGCNIIVNCQPGIRFSDTHNQSQVTHCKTELGFKNIPDVIREQQVYGNLHGYEPRVAFGRGKGHKIWTLAKPVPVRWVVGYRWAYSIISNHRQFFFPLSP